MCTGALPRVAARFMAMAQPWAVHLGFGKGNVLAAAATPGCLAWGLGGKRRRVFRLRRLLHLIPYFTS